MLRLFKKRSNIIDMNLLVGMTDVHSHLMYGVDDGSKELEQSKEMLSVLSNSGIKRAFCTPHAKVELTDNTTEKLKVNFAKFQEEVKDSSNIELRLAAEYMLDEGFIKKLETHDLLTYDGKHILIEMSRLSPPRNKTEVLFELQMGIYTPILAHPERYYKFESLKSLSRMKENGFKLQLNLVSLSGAYGEIAKKMALELLDADLYDFTGTDIHNSSIIRCLREIKVSSKFEIKLANIIENNSTLWK